MKTLYSLLLAVAFTIVLSALALANSHPLNFEYTNETADTDTIKFYAVSTFCQTGKGRTKYQVDGRSVSKKEYEKYATNFDNFINCKPCYVRTYSKNDKLLSEGDQFTDCRVGYWKEYYPNGDVKVEGQFKSDSTGEWSELQSANWCSIRHGKWTYYGTNGSIDSVVNYVNNIRVEQ